MVRKAICTTNKSLIIFVDSSPKINKDMYQKEIFEELALLWAQKYFGNECFCKNARLLIERNPHNADVGHFLRLHLGSKMTSIFK